MVKSISNESNQENVINIHGDKQLNMRKEWYKKKYIMRESIDGKTILFFEKNGALKTPTDTFKFVNFPDVYYDSRRKENVTSKNSAFVRLIMDRRIRRSAIPLSGWEGKKKCKKDCRKCLTRHIAVPITGKMRIKFTPDYIYNHLDKFKLYIECKIFDISEHDKFEIQRIDVAGVNTLNTHFRNQYICQLAKNDVPTRTLMKLFRLSRSQIKNIKADGRQRLMDKPSSE